MKKQPSQMDPHEINFKRWVMRWDPTDHSWWGPAAEIHTGD